MSGYKKAPYIGAIKLGNDELPCYVTEDGISLISSRKLQVVLGLVDSSKSIETSGSRLSRFLNQASLQIYFNKYFEPGHLTPIKCTGKDGKVVNGYPASILPSICRMMLEVRRDGNLAGPRQALIAEKCEILLGALAEVGIEALVHEATGFQKVRAKNALQQILDKYLNKHFALWAKRFPDDFYIQMFRLKGWNFTDSGIKKRPGVVGTYTNNIVYERLAPGILDELQKINPKNEKGNNKARHHQYLTEDTGLPALNEHLIGVISLMKASKTWNGFMSLLQQAFPKLNDQLELFENEESNTA